MRYTSDMSTIPNTKLHDWELVGVEDVSPSSWLPVEKRTYRLPDGTLVDDFMVVTAADVAMVVPRTREGKVVVVRQFKPGMGEVVIEFPAGRAEKGHKDLRETAIHELEEETGIRTDVLEQFALLAGFVTKATERVHCFFAPEVTFNSQQNLDSNEEIEVVELAPEELDAAIMNNEIQTAVTVAAWMLARQRYFGIER